jgi:hypothetical protein
MNVRLMYGMYSCMYLIPAFALAPISRHADASTGAATMPTNYEFAANQKGIDN